jgi:hypothetical protein
VTLIEVDVVGVQPRERRVQLLEDLVAGETLSVVRREEQLRREDVRVARAVGEHFAQKLFRAAARVDVGGVDEVDPDLERLRDASFGLIAWDAATVGQPRAEADLRDLELARAEPAVAHA